MNNLAELVTIDLAPRTVLDSQWQQEMHSKTDCLEWRNYVELSYFGSYYQQLLTNVIDAVDLPHKNIVVQYYNKHSSDKWSLNVVHRDAERLSCVTVSVTDIVEPVCFYTEAPPVRGAQRAAKPVQMSCYSQQHPTLVNVNNYHNVRILEDSSPRILLQVSYDYSFDDIVSRHPERWRLI